jgi:hypothetical protein
MQSDAFGEALFKMGSAMIQMGSTRTTIKMG